MNQRISIRALVRKDGKTLLLRRAAGRQSILGRYELPGGRIEYGEQPEDALRRLLHVHTGASLQTAQLFDAITYIDHDDRDIQYIVVVYLVGLAETGRPIVLSGGYDKYIWSKVSDIQQNEVTDLTQLLLGIVRQEQLTDNIAAGKLKKDVVDTTNKLIIYSDGGSRGNPGPSASAYVIMDAAENIVDTGGEYIGITTNNQAEYQAVYFALKRAQELGTRVIDFRCDSMLVVNQLNGIYKIKNRDLWPIHEEIVKCIQQFDRVSFTHIRREFNQLADGLVNKILDDRENTV